MEYIRGNTIACKWDDDTRITIIGRYCIVLDSNNASAVIVMESSQDKQVFMNAFNNPPAYGDEPIKLSSRLSDGAHLMMEACRGYVKLSIGEVVVPIYDESVEFLARNLL